MGGERKGPRARDRVIGARLRAIRKERTELSLEQAAALAQWSPSTMSRIETGKRHISPEDVATISTIYRLPVAQREELIESARAGNASGWWDLPLPGVPMDMGAIESYEAEATRLTDWSVNLIPGLLQTYRYATTLMGSFGVAAGDVEARWMARLRRQQILGNHPTSLVTHSWLLMEFPNTSPVVNVEAIDGSVFLHDESAKSYVRLAAELDRLTLSAPASQALIEEIHREL